MSKLGRKDPKQERAKGTVEAIYGAFARILDQDGPVALTTNKIAEVAGVSVGSLYQYFSGKESIVEALLVKMTEANLERVERILAGIEPGTKSVREVVTLIVMAQFEAMSRTGKMTGFLLQYAPKMLPTSHFQKADERIAAFLGAKIREHGFLKHTPHPKASFFVAFQAVRSTMFMAYVTQGEEERILIRDALIDMLSSYFEKLESTA